ncbi:MAG: hypothetical protein QM728_11565 [Gordonia sp. (in: high G+C Gram-positive bacteria)]|uniref:hypothetical protein n=1 Tax=Gordonia sp. (in: high G+C Gram-positive bacteria) TaxID=84139 RepID=UPI0039E3F220
MSTADTGSIARATRRWREARIAAAPALRRQAARRRHLLRLALRAVAGLIIVAAVAALVFGLLARRDDKAVDRGEQARAAARSAVTTMLTADPRAADKYVDAVLAVTTGGQRDRIAGARGELAAEIAKQTAPSTGQVVSTALVGEPSTSGTVDVLVVAEATNPELIGASTTAKRVPVVVTMSQSGDRWLIAKARQG